GKPPVRRCGELVEGVDRLGREARTPRRLAHRDPVYSRATEKSLQPIQGGGDVPLDRVVTAVAPAGRCPPVGELARPVAGPPLVEGEAGVRLLAVVVFLRVVPVGDVEAEEVPEAPDPARRVVGVTECVRELVERRLVAV